LPTLAADLVRQRVSVIIAETPVAALAAKHATTSIPIVFSLGSDPVRDGLVASLNRPGGNITGATFLSNLLSAKRLDLFQRFVPDAKVIAALLNPKNANVELETRDTQEAAGPLGLQLVLLRAGDEREAHLVAGMSFPTMAGCRRRLASSFFGSGLVDNVRAVSLHARAAMTILGRFSAQQPCGLTDTRCKRSWGSRLTAIRCGAGGFWDDH